MEQEQEKKLFDLCISFNFKTFKNASELTDILKNAEAKDFIKDALIMDQMSLKDRNAYIKKLRDRQKN